MNQSTTERAASEASDFILFECPTCGKSLEIDARGAGYIVVCPDCKNEIQVPAWSASGEAPEANHDSADRERIQLESMLEQLNAKIDRLEKARQNDEHCFRRLADEIELIQAALDRITEIVASRQA
ncbi:MAG TPA: hypothetical protein PKE26_12525 [Kiritimatiellia bacterium]|nr:hypothetical protein [Kiritimatiellia bacterium]HMO99926.1 hypothetical protein [Kiritimatiellia bacterium]HMP98099.1 hypothetical protein [Kiritimatiellia bacterium]